MTLTDRKVQGRVAINISFVLRIVRYQALRILGSGKAQRECNTSVPGEGEKTVSSKKFFCDTLLRTIVQAQTTSMSLFSLLYPQRI